MRLFDVLRKRSTGLASKVYGRDEEFGILQDALDRVSETESISSEMVLVHGCSGCGKSSMVKALQQWTKEERDDLNVYFGSGKYDQLVNNEPFAAIIAASNKLCQGIDDSMAKRFAKVLRAKTGGDTAMLCNAIPSLTKLLVTADRQAAKEAVQNGTSMTAAMNQPNNTDFEATALAFTRFKQLWQSLLLAIASCSESTVLFLDDVQWADPNSIDLIHSLTKITQARNILIICAFRDDATMEKAQLDRIRWCFSLDDSQSNSLSMSSAARRRLSTGDTTKLTVPLTDIILTNLDASSMKEVVAGLLYGQTGDEETCEHGNCNDNSNNNSNTIIDTQRISDLSNVVLTHTGGNPFFVLHYLDYLTRIGLLRTSDDGISWEWDIESIANQESVPQSIAQLLRRVMDDLPSSTRNVLVTAAHVRFCFPSGLFQQQTLQEHISSKSDTGASVHSRKESSFAAKDSTRKDQSFNTDVEAILESAVKEGLLECVTDYVYAFPHDQIQKAFYSTMTDRPKRQQKLHLNIGLAMLSMIEKVQNKQTDDNIAKSGLTSVAIGSDTAIFVAVDNMNKGAKRIKDLEMCIALARLNYNAARAAMSKAAMQGALEYIRVAVALLGPNGWTIRYELMLDVWTLAAELEQATGHHMQCQLMLGEIQAEGRDVFDKLQSYFTGIEALASNRQYDKAIQLGVTVLGLLGEPMPAKPGILRVGLELRTTSKLMNKVKEAGFMSLPKMTDPTKLAALKVLGKLAALAFLCGSKCKNLSTLLMLRTAAVCCLHGHSPYSPLSFLCYAAIKCALGQFEECREFLSVATNLLSDIEGTEINEAEVLGGKFAVTLPWCEGVSLSETQPEFIRCYHKAMAYGDITRACMSACHYIVCALIRGTPISELDRDCERYIDEMDQFQINHTKVLALGYWRMARILTGRNDHTCAGDSIAVTHLYREVDSMEQTEFMICAGIAFQILPRVLLGTFGAYETLEEDQKMLLVLIKDPEATAIYFCRPICDLALALGCISLHKKTRKRRYKRSARRVFLSLEKLYKKRASIAMGPYLLVRAERMAAEGGNHSWESIQADYTGAIEQSRRHGGFAAVEGYALERLAALSADRGDQQASLQYYREALATYDNWGATEKTQQLVPMVEGVRRAAGLP